MLFFFGLAHAVTISPVLIDINAKEKVVAVRFSNDGAKPISLQAESLRWTQVDGADRYEEIDDLLVVPAIAEIAPGSTQIFRVTLRDASLSQQERSYRLILDDISDTTSEVPDGVAFRLSHNLPVFVAPAGKPVQQARWQQCVAPAGKGCVRLENTGNVRLRVHSMTVEGEGWKQPLKGSMTVLSGGWKELQFDLPTGASQPKRITARSEKGQIAAEILP